jgi:hypothetical protein
MAMCRMAVFKHENLQRLRTSRKYIPPWGICQAAA